MVKPCRNSVSLSDLWVTSHDKLSDFYASSWQRGESPVPMLVLRLILALIAVGILTWSIVVSPTPYWLVYLTNWGLLLIVLMTLSGLLVSCVAVQKKAFDNYKVPWYMGLYWFLYNITVTIAIIITALYWLLLYNPDPEEPDTDKPMFFLDLATHAINSCVAIVEVLSSRTPIRFMHMYQPLGLGLWYAAFSGIFYAAGGTVNGYPYIYEVLDWQQAQRAGTLVALSMVGVMMVYTVLWGLALCRDKISTSLIRTTSQDLAAAPPDRHMVDGIV